jgi:hypothetical protein
VPPEHRAGGFTLDLVMSQGVSAFGAMAWGAFGARFGFGTAFIVAGALFIVF